MNTKTSKNQIIENQRFQENNKKAIECLRKVEKTNEIMLIFIFIDVKIISLIINYQNYLWPLAISLNIRISPLKLNQGYLKAAGLFFSKKKCPTQEKPYPMISANKTLMNVKLNRKVLIIWRIASKVPIKCSLLQVLFLCSER